MFLKKYSKVINLSEMKVNGHKEKGGDIMKFFTENVFVKNLKKVVQNAVRIWCGKFYSTGLSLALL